MSVNTLACNSNLTLLDKMANVQKPSLAPGGGNMMSSTGGSSSKYTPLLARMQKIQKPTTTAGTAQAAVDPAEDLFSSQRLVRNLVRSASKVDVHAECNVKVATNDSYWSEDEC